MRLVGQRGGAMLLLSFGVGFAVFSLLFLALMGLTHPGAEAVTPANANVADVNESYHPAPADALTVLFMGGTQPEDAPGIFVLARFDPAQKRIALVVLPAQTGVWNNGAQEALAQVYRYGGADYVRQALQKTLGLPIDRYVWVGAADFLKIAPLIGTVELELTRAMTLNKSGAELHMGAGRQLLDGSKALALLRAAVGRDREAAPENLAEQLLAELVNQRIDIALAASVDNIFRQIVNTVRTDITYMDYHERKQAAAWLAQSRTPPAHVLTAQGVWQGQGDMVFLLSDTCLAQMREVFHSGNPPA